jgi:hypothetical protein
MLAAMQHKEKWIILPLEAKLYSHPGEQHNEMIK